MNGTALQILSHRRLLIATVVGVCLCTGLVLFAVWRRENEASPNVLRPITIPSTVMVTLGDGGMAPATFATAPGQPRITKTEALAIARRYVAGAPQATGVQIWYTRLTLPDTSGFTDHQPINQRPVWLVQYNGVPFSALPVCACAYLSAQPNSDVAIDTTTGKPVALFGSA